MPIVVDENRISVSCQEALSLLRTIDAGSIQLVVTDPPYGISYQSNRRIEEKSKPIAKDWNFQIGPFLRDVFRVLKDGGACYMFTRWDVFPLWMTNIPPGLSLKNLIVWNKNTHTAGDLTGNFGFKWEGIMFLVKGRHRLRGPRYSNVWDFPRVSFSKQIHPAEKPVALLQRAIEASSDADDWILDPFSGSGSTGEAAHLSNRCCLLGEIDEDYVRKSKVRLGLPPDDILHPVETFEPATSVPFEINLDSLEGIHPDDISALAEYLQQRKLEV